MEQGVLGMGCFWPAAGLFRRQPRVHATVVGYAGGTKVDADYPRCAAGAPAMRKS